MFPAAGEHLTSIPPAEGLQARAAALLWANPKSHAGALGASSAAAWHSPAAGYGSTALAVSSVLPKEKHIAVVITQTNEADLDLPFKET